MSSLFYHHVLVQGIVDCLHSIFFDQKHADKVIESTLKKHRKWGSRDRRLVAETIYEVVRWRRWYEHILMQVKPASVSAATKEDANEYLWGLWAVHCYIKKIDWPVWYEEASFFKEKINKWNLNKSTKPMSRAIQESIPDWMDQMGAQALPNWDSILKSLNFPSTVDLRANALKSESQNLQKLLQADGIDVYPIKDPATKSVLPNAFTLSERKNVFASEAFKKGLFEVQDRASQLVAPFLKAEPGMRVADTCAGSGGKSLHLAALMKNKGKIIALDIHDWKLQELKKRAARDGVDIIETRCIDSAKVIKRLEGSFDRVLMDVPCSGMGVLRRNPDSKWKLSEPEIQRLIQTQSDLLNQYSKLVKNEGLIVYSTCSILPSENEQQIEKFLADHPEFELQEQLRVNPDEGRGDGFFMARMKKTK